MQSPGRARKSHAELARQVLDVARALSMRPGDPLAEQAIAAQCGVSRTPVRAAFMILQSGGFLMRRPGGGFALAVDLERNTGAMERQLEAPGESLADRILADRAARRLDETLSVSSLARRYAVTRPAVQNALKVLQQDGVLDRGPGHAWSFRPILDTAEALAESHQFRLVTEPQAILAPGFELDQARARQLRQQTEDLRDAGPGGIGAAAFHALDTEFHALVARGSANRFLREALLAHHRLRRITQKEIGAPEFRLRQALAEHLDILDSLEGRQFDVAADQMSLHLRLSRRQRPDAANRGSPPLTRGSR